MCLKTVLIPKKKSTNAPAQPTNKLTDYRNQFLEFLSPTKRQNLIVCEEFFGMVLAMDRDSAQ